MGFSDISRRQLLISGVISGLIGAGVTGSSGLNSIEGNVSVQAQQAINLTSVTTASADSDTSFTNIGDGDTSFGAAVELNNGDSTEIFIDLRNSSSVALKTRAIIKQLSPLSVSPRIADDDDLQGDNTVVQTGKDTYVFTIPAQRIVRFVLRISVPDTASPGASDVRISFDPLSTNKDEQPSTDSGPKIEDARLFDTADEDGVVSDGETVRIEATVTEFNGLKLVTTDASEFDPELGPVTLTDDGPGVSQSDDKFSAEFVVGENADEGTDRTVDIKATDNEGVETEETANSLVVRNVETDNDAPTISSVSLSDVTDSDGVVSGDDKVKINATVEDAANAGEITEVTADASDFGAGDVTLYSSSPPSGNPDGGERTESATFTVGSDATEGTEQTVTLTVEDENGENVADVNAADEFGETLEVDNDTPTISSVSLSDETDSDGVVSDGDEVKIEATVEDAANAGEITEVTADASDFGAGDVELSNTDTSEDNEAGGGGKRTVSETFAVGESGAAIEGEQTVTITATDENEDSASKLTDSLEVDNDAPTISGVTLSDETDSDGVVSDGDRVKIETTVEDATNAGEITEVTADASDFGAGDVELSNTDTSEDNEAGGGGERTVSETFAVGESGTASKGTGQTVTITATDENDDSASTTTGSLEVDNAAPTISSVSLSDETDSDGVVSTGDTVEVQTTVKDAETAQEITEVTADASDFGVKETVTLYSSSPPGGNPDEGTRTESATFTVGSDATEGTGQTVTLTVEDENGNEVIKVADKFGETLEVDNDAPTISGVTLSDETDSDGVVSKDDEVKVTATIKDATNAGEITEVTVDASDFGVKETVTLYSSSPPSGNPDGGIRTESVTFTVGSDATEGTGQTVTLTVEDENSDKDTNVNAANKFSETLEVDNAAPTISSVSLTDQADEDGDVDPGDTVRITATVTDDNQIENVEAEASTAGSFDLDSTPVTLTDGGPGASTSDDTFGAEFNVGDNPDTGDQSVTVTVTDEAGNTKDQESNSLTVGSG
jgi:hypothetical protein